MFRGGSGVQRTGRPAIRIRELSGEIEINEQQVVDLITAEALTKPLAGRYDAIEPLATLRPGIVYVSENAYGQVGPWRDRPGWEQLANAMSSNWPEAAITSRCLSSSRSRGYRLKSGFIFSL